MAHCLCSLSTDPFKNWADSLCSLSTNRNIAAHTQCTTNTTNPTNTTHSQRTYNCTCTEPLQADHRLYNNQRSRLAQQTEAHRLPKGRVLPTHCRPCNASSNHNKPASLTLRLLTTDSRHPCAPCAAAAAGSTSPPAAPLLKTAAPHPSSSLLAACQQQPACQQRCPPSCLAASLFASC